ncbi:MAG: hypothetical protein ABW221_07850 [Vicinamibacteria bacterium]
MTTVAVPVTGPRQSNVPPNGDAVTPPAEPTTAWLAELSDAERERIRARLVAAIGEHDVPIDPWMFNGGTVVVLILSAAAAFLPSLGGQAPVFAAPLCSAFAGLVVAMERALGFGARWRFHREMRSAYENVLDMLDFLPVVPRPERPKYTRDMLAALYSARAREAAIPNAGNQAPPT